MSLTKPTQIAVPFAASGSKTAIPATADNVTGRAGYDAGFPAITRTAKAAGGIPPFGTDFNGIFYDAFSAIQYLEAGGAFPYDSTFAAAIGGYPVGALVSRADGMGLWKNLVAGNTTNPDNLGAGWDTFDSGITSVTMTSSNVTLTAQQAARDIIVISGVLTANLNLIFPVFNKSWTIINGSTGAFTVTCKTSTGTGISFSSGDSIRISCDGVNILTNSGSSSSPLRVGSATSQQQAATLGQLQNYSGIKTLAATVASNALTVTLPSGTPLSFRSPMLSDGSPVSVITTSQLSLTVPSGATLGSISATLANLAVVAIYNGGTPVLGIVNLAGGVDLSESGLIASTTISASSSSASVVYSTSAVALSPYVVIGLLQIIEATAGTWAAAPSTVVGRGANLISQLGGLGYSAPTDVTASRSLSTTYYNTSCRPKKVKIMFSGVSTSGFTTTLTVNGVVVDWVGFGGTTAATTRTHSVEWIVAPGESYSVTSGMPVSSWIEA